MIRRKIIPIVEGYGEERAVPCLLQRWLRHRKFHKYFEIPDLAINAKSCGRLKAGYDKVRHIGIEHYIIAALRNKPDAILVVIDADDECINRGHGNGLGPELLARAKTVAPNVPLAVVVANREYEAWFLASLTSIRAAGLLPNTTRLQFQGPMNPEDPRDCKGLITKLMGCRYEATVHQLELTRGLTFSPKAQYRSPSYGKLLRDLERITHEARRKPTE
ncbi:MAG: DUF4276 family protein [Desulfobacterales bacterium]|uniref:DUF4276 family protein n=1 Tax=Candidatus Desulfatibia vada TaxID=2841696 RepID=A0A8J6TKZ6_9BACT|nr:DUF4276 family protein [Candidatus Desulfatibia vada]